MEQSIPAHFLSTALTSKRAWREAGEEGAMAGGEEQYAQVCVKIKKEKKGRGGTINSWVEVNKAVSVWTLSLTCYVLSLFSSWFIPHTIRPPSVSTSGQHLLSSFTLSRSRPQSLCAPPSSRKFGCNQMFNRKGSPAECQSIQAHRIQAHSNTLNHTHAHTHLKQHKYNWKYWEFCNK